jgi:hypothetical protein
MWVRYSMTRRRIKGVKGEKKKNINVHINIFVVVAVVVVDIFIIT